MRGYLTFLVLWILKWESLNGAEIARNLQKRRGTKPSPGTIYPVLKDLNKKGLVSLNRERKYSLTKKGERELQTACSFFCRIFYDIEDMFNCCHQKPHKSINDCST